ncbi:MAG: hypothetical protein OEZ57_15225 [Nitrospirota bacterium]|nr:hypothetical protein [Nitrospirota bacterium]
MKLTTWALMVFTLVLFCSAQATASRIEGEIMTQEGSPFQWLSSSTTYIYPGTYTIKLLAGTENLGCTLRLGTKSSQATLLTISGPLAVRNVTDPLQFFASIGREILRSDFSGLPFTCGTTGTIQVSNPPTVAVPVMVTLTYGPFLQRTVPLLVTQKFGIKSLAASPTRQYYSLNQRVSITLTPTRKTFTGEGHPDGPYFRVREGRLCLINSYREFSFTASDGWKRLPNSYEFEDGQPITRLANLCQEGRTIVEFGFPDSEMGSGSYRMMTDSRIQRLEFMVSTQSPPRKSRIRSRGIEALSPLVIPDPEPPALPNFELQGNKP